MHDDQYAVPVGFDGAINSPDEGGPAKVAAPLPLTPGVVITPPDPDMVWMPYEQADRTPAGPLQQLEGFAAVHLGVHPDTLISRRGQICQEGSVVLFQRNAEPGDALPERYLVVAHGGRSRFRVTERTSWEAALNAYDVQVEELS